jgi:hypothetical protein
VPTVFGSVSAFAIEESDDETSEIGASEGADALRFA